MKTLVAQAMAAGRARRQHLAAVRARPLRLDRRDRRAGEGGAPSTAASTSRTSARSRTRSSTSLDEVFAIAERADIPAEVWHLKTAYKANWGRMPEVLRRIEAARARGLDVTANIYPYDRASNGLDACLPLWVREGGLEPMLQRLKDPALRERIKRDMDDPNATDWENQWYGSGGGAGVMLSTGARSGAAQVRRQDPRRDRQGDGQGPARRGDGPGHRRSRPSRR